jgi:glycosyltransferase involved in cell wall biosynthesis
MRVSVIIPVYNAEEYLSSAVVSALAQPETEEVLLIEDCSRDGSLRVCLQLADEYPKVRVFRHSPSRNYGAGASRNLGIKNSRYEYLAFLDADDFFLPGRFASASRMFEAYPEIDGVYETIGTHFENEEVKKVWLAEGRAVVTGFREQVAPELLFENQGPVGSKGYASPDAWVVKKTVFDRTGLFDEELRLHQDAAMGLKLSALCRMAIGDIDRPVAMRRVHAANRISAKRSPSRQYCDFLRMWRVLWRWGRLNLEGNRRGLLLNRYLTYASRPFTEIENELKRTSFVPACQLIYAMSRDMGLISEKLFRQKLTQCITNFKAYVG